MMPETISSGEMLRFLSAFAGLIVSWRGRSSALRAAKALLRPETHRDEAAWSRYEDDLDRAHGAGLCQLMYVGCHLLLLVNVVVNFAYASAPIEQSNVLTSNLAQGAIPLLLIVASRWQTDRMERVAERQARDERRRLAEDAP